MPKGDNGNKIIFMKNVINLRCTAQKWCTDEHKSASATKHKKYHIYNEKTEVH